MDGELKEYRKTATIRAVQYLGQAVVGVCTGGPYCKSRGGPDDAVPHIHTLEGDLTVSHGDWIATGVQGEHWAIKPDVFAATYAEAERKLSDPVSPLTADLHPKTAQLVNSFAIALAHKLRRAEEKYGYSDGWLTDDWEGKCRADLRAHVEKGDPLDVAAYAAFCWARNWSTAEIRALPTTPSAEAREGLMDRLEALDNGTASEAPWVATGLASEAAKALRAIQGEAQPVAWPQGWLIRESDGGWFWTGNAAAVNAARNEEREVVRLSDLHGRDWRAHPAPEQAGEVERLRGEERTTQAWSDRCVAERVARKLRADADKMDKQDRPQTADGLREDAAAIERLSAAEQALADMKAERDEAVKHLHAMSHVAPRAFEVEAATAFLARLSKGEGE